MEPELRGGELYKYQEEEESEEVKYICYFEFKPEDLDKVIPLFQKMRELRGTPDYPKGISPTYVFSGQMCGFTLYEVDDPKQITNHALHYHPLIKFTWKPLTEASDIVATYMNMKK